MQEEIKNRDLSEDYADFIIDLRANLKISELFQDAVIHNINNTYAVIHLPLSQFINQQIKNIRLLIIPKVLGLASEAALEDSGVLKLRKIPDFNLKGSGVLIGIIDTGIKYTLPAFQKPDKTTRIQYLWDQTIQSDNQQPLAHYGTEYTAKQINQALKAEKPLEIVPSTDENGHGTMLAAIAAGTENVKEDFYGVAPEADYIIVKLKQAKKYLRDFYVIPNGVVCYEETDVMWGVHYCISISRVLNRPIAICIGIGTSQSGHDDTAPLEKLLSDYADSSGTGIVTAAGNEGNLGRHYHGTINPKVGNVSVELNIGEKDTGFSMQFWGDAPGIYSIDILSPSGEYIPRIPAGFQVSRDISFVFEKTTIYLNYQTVEPLSGDELIVLNLHNATAGIWKFTVYQQGDFTGNINVWLPMGDFISRETYFIQQDNYTTLITPSNADIPISVTAFDPVGGSLYAYASRGYTRTNMIKPELASPGVNYRAPKPNGNYANFTGTGVAAAHATGIAALFLEWGIVRGNQPEVDTLDIKKYLIRGARRSENMTYPNRDWGYGIIDLYNTFNILRTSV